MKPHVLLFALVAACSQETPTADSDPATGASPEVHYYSLGRN